MNYREPAAAPGSARLATASEPAAHTAEASVSVAEMSST